MSEQYYRFMKTHSKSKTPKTIEEILTADGYDYPAMIADGFRYDPSDEDTLLDQAEEFNYCHSEAAY